MDSVVEQLDTGKMGSAFRILPVDQDVVDKARDVLVNDRSVVGVCERTRDGLVGPSTSPMVPDGNTTLILDSKVVSRGEEALLGVVVATSGIWQRGPSDSGPVGFTSGLLDKVEDNRAIGVIADHVGHVIICVDDDAGVLEHWWRFCMPLAGQCEG